MLVWRRHLRRGDLFVDVGANVGAYSLWVGEQGIRVIAIEPDPGACQLLRENAALNGYDIQILECALANYEGEARLTDGLDSRNHLAAARRESEVVQTVSANTLDDVLGNRTAAGVKLDVEGTEFLVLKGAERALRERRIKLLQLEWNDRSVAVLGQDRRPVARLLEVFGYSLFRPDDEGVLHPVNDVDFGPDVFAGLAADNSCGQP